MRVSCKTAFPRPRFPEPSKIVRHADKGLLKRKTRKSMLVMRITAHSRLTLRPAFVVGSLLGFEPSYAYLMRYVVTN